MTERNEAAAKWQLPKSINPETRHPHYVLGEYEGKFREVYATSTQQEMAQWFGVSKTEVYKLAKRLWGDGMPKRVSRLKRLKEQNPVKFAEMQERMAAKRRETYRKERRRLEMGLPLQTGVKIVLNPMKNASRTCKANMISRRNYFADDAHTNWICYDSSTRRSERCEANARKHGFRIVEGAEEEPDTQTEMF